MEQVANPILSKLKSTALALRKEKSPLGAFITSVLSDAQNLAKADTKDGVEPPLDDTYAVRAIRTNIKQQEENLAIFGEDASKGFGVSAAQASFAKMKKNVLIGLLPQEASEDEILAAAKEFIVNAEGNKKKLIGPTIKHLTDKFGASLNKGLASNLVQSLLKD